jgi:hypothetical protein
MKALLDQIIEARYLANTFYYESPVRPQPNGPASAAELQRLDTWLASKGLVAPAAYKEFLSVYNGIENVLGRSYSLLSIDGVLQAKDAVLEEIVDDFPNICEFVIGAGNTPNILGFDVSTASGADGYEVAEISDTGDESRYTSFEEFLQRLLANLEKNILTQQRDRQNLPP